MIAPIGDEGSVTRRRSDQVLQHIIKPAAEHCGYRAVRADKSHEPGLLTPRIVQYLEESPIAVADLTGSNWNVIYELAYRHIIEKPVVHIIDLKQEIPFDVGDMRTIKFDIHDLDSVDKCKREIEEEILAADRDPSAASNPISLARHVRAARESGDPVKGLLVSIRASISELSSEVENVKKIVLGPEDHGEPDYDDYR